MFEATGKARRYDALRDIEEHRLAQMAKTNGNGAQSKVPSFIGEVLTRSVRA
jgi:hypothetical protein